MTLWLVLAIMTAAAVFAVLWPLSRHRSAAGGSDMLVYRDQLEEIARDRAAGRIGEAEAEAARIEVSRHLLAAADRQEKATAVTSLRWRRAIAVAALVLLPASAVALYLAIGSPSLPGQPLAARMESDGNAAVARMVTQIETHLQNNPEDSRGWEVLAPVYLQLERYDAAVRAWQNAILYGGPTALRQANLGEALIAVGNGRVTADAKAALQRALALDPEEPKARYLLGLAAAQEGQTAEAAKIWQALLAQAPADAPWADFVRESLAKLGDAVDAPAAGPTADDMAAAANMDPAQRQQMIAGMVERLAARLKADGTNIDGWLQLVRAYTVLGDRDKARAAVSDARDAIGSDAEKRRRLDELAKGLGLEG
jgi:cytochrome c-type biogenesis protein CcmH